MKKVFFVLICTMFSSLSVFAQFTTNQWYWGSGPNWWDGSFIPPASNDYRSDLYRMGSINFGGPDNGGDLQTQGIKFYRTNGELDDVWGFPSYGLTLSKFDKLNLSQFDTYGWNNVATVASGFAGLALRSQYAATLLHQNGIVSIGLNMDWHKPMVRQLSKKESEWGNVLSGYMLYVRQGIVTEKIKVALMENWPDYVFRKGYVLLPLSQVEAHIARTGHLPNIPSAATIEKEGVELGDMTKRHQEKIEEVFLHLIEMDKRLQATDKRVQDLERENAVLKAQLAHPPK